ncbi:MAG: glycoside hydrolase [Sphingomonas sp.]|nr:glycoside hydrolase [Sphingomonas sp.]
MLLQTTSSLGATNYSVDVPMKTPTTTPEFADEFNDPEIDTEKWRYDTSRNAEGWFNNEKQYYAADRPKNARIEDGALVIEAHRESLSRSGFADWGGQEYTSAKLVTRQLLGYGFYEIRAKLPCGRGTWPAIWMLPETGEWPDQGEIDIMEMVGWDANVVHGTLHSGAFNHRLGTQRGAQVTIPSACTAYHRYQLSWTRDRILIGYDDRGYMEVRDDQPGGHAAWPFDRPFALILNLAIGGDWGGKEGIDDAALPQRMSVDYVRFWPAPEID